MDDNKIEQRIEQHGKFFAAVIKSFAVVFVFVALVVTAFACMVIANGYYAPTFIFFSPLGVNLLLLAGFTFICAGISLFRLQVASVRLLIVSTLLYILANIFDAVMLPFGSISFDLFLAGIPMVFMFVFILILYSKKNRLNISEVQKKFTKYYTGIILILCILLFGINKLGVFSRIQNAKSDDNLRQIDQLIDSRNIATTTANYTNTKYKYSIDYKSGAAVYNYYGSWDLVKATGTEPVLEITTWGQIYPDMYISAGSTASSSDPVFSKFTNLHDVAVWLAQKNRYAGPLQEITFNGYPAYRFGSEGDQSYVSDRENNISGFDGFNLSGYGIPIIITITSADSKNFVMLVTKPEATSTDEIMNSFKFNK